MTSFPLPRPHFIDPLIALAAVAPALLDQVTTDTSRQAWTALAVHSVVAAGGLLVRRRLPLTGFAVMLTTLAVVEIWCAAQEVQLGNLAVLPLAFSLYAVGAYCTLPRALAGVCGGTVLVCLGVMVNHATATTDWRGGSDVFATVAPLPVACALGIVVQSHRLTLEAVRARAADAQREHTLLAERAAAAERVRIARDMHDVVAHSLTLLVVHAETMRARSADLPPWASRQVDALAAAGRQATVEMRELLGVLRNGTPPERAPLSPAPSFAELPELVRSARQAGNPVRLDIHGDPATLPKPVQLMCYRIVQETLANARRHAPGAAVTIGATVAGSAVRVAVRSAPSPYDVVPVPGAGTGLEGMRERVTALGGEFTAGGTEDGGFLVTASVPPAQDAGRTW
ncbi:MULTISPECIES: sensor histidine kinase [Streptomyces]|uniref:histidine kinase n=1 Tax=Streptomyces harbinensis TaxID=1176198 RepID=A0A1I6R049_9ACTN|nr:MULTISPECIES: histidine kinase [Streptomyces]MCK1813984.1 histidine kinase [Streptomyces sp. XM4011]QKV67597.1 two-component sensor histidine kinase [Streptomyces harbinensis]SFS58107.1 Histidine kinase [Streptomyces harbinensis]